MHFSVRKHFAFEIVSVRAIRSAESRTTAAEGRRKLPKLTEVRPRGILGPGVFLTIPGETAGT